jgi:hypothetical protein
MFLLLNPWGGGDERVIGHWEWFHIYYTFQNFGMVRVHGCSYNDHSKVQKWLEAYDN